MARFGRFAHWTAQTFQAMAMNRHTSFFDAPHAATFTLIGLNILVFGILLIGNDPMRISSATLFFGGALYSETIPNKEYWRFFAYAFLHINVIHLAMNMICMLMWAGILERRVGVTNFLTIYFAAAVGGGLASIYGHQGAFISVGASGAISGVVGALLALTLLGKLPLTPQFFIVNIGLNAALIAIASNIDWMAHLGGLIAGLIACAVLDAVATANRYWLRCHFPEFVKLGLAVTGIAAAAWLIPDPSLLAEGSALPQVAALVLGMLLVVKATDLLLARLKGLAVVTVALTVVYAALPLIFARAVWHVGAVLCTIGATTNSSVLARAGEWPCRVAALAPYWLAALILLAALLVLGRELRRGWRDVGFIGAHLIAERNRRRGI